MRPALTSRALNRRMAGAGLMRRPARGGGGVNRPIPQQVPGLFAWWDAGSGITIETGVSVWTDRHGGHVLAQGTAANQAAYSAAHASMNSKPALTFDGANDALASNEASSVWKFLGGDQVSVYAAYRISARNWNPVIATENNGGGGDRSGIMLAAREAATFANDTWSVWAPKITSGFHATATSPAGDANVGARSYIAYHGPGGLSQLRPSYPDASATALTVLGAQGSLDPSSTLAVGGFAAGGTYFQGQICQLLIYNAAVSAAADDAIRAYLVSEYAI